jgi:DNA-binding NtrC family response regulator
MGILGYQPYTAQTSSEAQKVYHQYREQICLVVLDMMTPGLNGYEVYQTLSENDPKAKFLIITGYSHSELMGKLFQRKRTAFIRKPIVLSELTHKINRLIEDPAPIQPSAAPPDSDCHGGLAKHFFRLIANPMKHARGLLSWRTTQSW